MDSKGFITKDNNYCFDSKEYIARQENIEGTRFVIRSFYNGESTMKEVIDNLIQNEIQNHQM